MMKRIMSICVAVALAGCAATGSGGGGTGGNGEAEITTVEYERQTDGSYVLTTNDAQYADGDGTAFFAYQMTGAPSGAFRYSVDMVKYAGSRDGGYGLVFQREDASNFWVFLIDAFGSYYLAKVLDGREYAKLESYWKRAPELRQSYGTTNRIEIAYDGSENYTVSANGTEILGFKDSGGEEDGRRLSGGSLGIVANVMPGESFPETPVWVRFSVVEPDDIEFGDSMRAIGGSGGRYAASAIGAR